MAQYGLEGLHVRAGLDGQGGVGVAQGVDDQPLDILHARVLQGRGPHPVSPVCGVLPSSPWPAQQVVLGAMPVQQGFDPGQQLAGYRHEPGPVAFRQGLHQEVVGIDRLGA